MKWCFLLNNIDLMMEFLGKLSFQVIREGDDCILAANSKIAEFQKRKYFPPKIKLFSRIDWCNKNYKEDQTEFGNLSWKELFPDYDRFSDNYHLFKYDYHKSRNIISQIYQFADFILKTEKPDIVLNEMPSNLFTEIFFNLCEKYNILYLGFVGSRFQGKIDVYDKGYTCSKYEPTFNQLKIGDITKEEKKFAEDFLGKFLTHKEIPPYMKFQNELADKGRISRVAPYFKQGKEIIKNLLKYLEPIDYESRIAVKYNFLRPWFYLKKEIRSILQRNIYEEFKKEDKFLFFPLHLQPESSTSVQATYFCDQLNTIKNTAFSLPFPYKLYIKEHPSAVGTRRKEFYRNLRKIPNVVLLSPYENVENLIRNCQGVITLTSTVGMEAALIGKPVYVLGSVFYSYHPKCRKIESFEQLKKEISKDLNQKLIINNQEDINIRFVISCFGNAVSGSEVDSSSKDDKNNYRLIYNDIKRIFLSKK